MEGNYNTWTKVWLNDVPDGLQVYTNIDWLVDEVREVISIAWTDTVTSTNRWGVFKLSDFSQVFLGTNYIPNHPDLTSKRCFSYGGANDLSSYAAHPRSILSYLLLLRADQKTLEIWRGASTPLWSHDLDTDFSPVGDAHYVAGISSTGKYITILCGDTSKIALYSGTLV